MSTLTGANSTIFLGITGLFTTPQQLQGFDVDDVFSTTPVKSVEVKMGVDGTLSAGFVHMEKVQSFTLQGDSPSNDIFDTWAAIQESEGEAFVAFGIINLPAVSKSYAMIGGYLTSYMPIANVKKLLQPRLYEITWQNIQAAPLG